MGPRSVDGTGQNNPIRSEGPWGVIEPYSTVVHQRVIGPTQSGATEFDYAMHEGAEANQASVDASG
jgi:hypothetical protein